MEGEDRTDTPRADSAPFAYILLPTLDEERSIGHVIRDIPCDNLRALGYTPRIIVIDGDSRDMTRRLASETGAEVLLQRGRGKGQAIRHICEVLLNEDLAATLQRNGDSRYVVLDADGTYPPERIVDFVRHVDQGFDLVLGSRFLGTIDPGAMTTLNWIGNRLLTRLFRVLYGMNVTDICTGMYAFNPEVLRALELTTDGFDIEAEIFAAVCRMNATVGELAITYRPRIGLTKMIPLRTGLRIGWRILVDRLKDIDGVSPPRPARRRVKAPLKARMAARFLSGKFFGD